MSFQKRVELVGILQHPEGGWSPEDYASSGAKGCFDELSASKLQERDSGKDNDGIFKETSGRGHGAVLDLSEFVFSIDNLSRASTLFLCGPQYAAHLQQSLRRATAERGFASTDIPGANKVMEEQFEFYTKMQEAGIPSEDARFILPLNTKTAIESKWNARELMHLYSMAQRMSVPEEVRDTAEKMYQLASEVAPNLMKDRKNNMEVLAWMPSPQLFAKGNSSLERRIDEVGNSNFHGAKLLSSCGRGFMTSPEIERAVKERDEALLANLKSSYHFNFLAAMSLASFHQATRQRTWDQSVQALPEAVNRGGYILPESIKESEFEEKYQDINTRSIQLVRDNLKNPEALGILPHSLKVYDLIHVNGWNAIHSIGKRTCTEAQWEIRGIASNMAYAIQNNCPELGKYAAPQGVVYGKCPEKKPCGDCFKKK